MKIQQHIIRNKSHQIEELTKKNTELMKDIDEYNALTKLWTINIENSFPYCAWSFFTKKFFLGFLFGSTLGTPKQYSALKQEEQMFL